MLVLLLNSHATMGNTLTLVALVFYLPNGDMPYFIDPKMQFFTFHISEIELYLTIDGMPYF